MANRRSRRGHIPTVTDDEDSEDYDDDEEEDDDEVVEALSNLVDLAGLVKNNNEGDPWIELSNSLYDVSKSLRVWTSQHDMVHDRQKRIPGNDHDDGREQEHVDIDNATNTALLDMEESIRRTKIYLSRVDDVVTENSKMYIEECQKLENLYLKRRHQCRQRRRKQQQSQYNRDGDGDDYDDEDYDHLLLPLSKSILVAFQKQKSFVRQNSMATKHQLDQIYADGSNGSNGIKSYLSKVVSTIEILAEQFRTRFIKSITESPWNKVIGLIEQLGCKNTDDDDDDDDDNDDDNDDETHLTTSSRNKEEDVRYCRLILPSYDSSGPTIDNRSGTTTTTTTTSQSSLFDTVHQLLTIRSGGVHSILLLGPEASGKSYCLSEIEMMAKQRFGATVLRPVLPYDVIGSTVGEAEDNLISMFSFSKHHDHHQQHTQDGSSPAASSRPVSLLILDDIDTVCGSFGGSSSSANVDTSSANNTEPHSTTRLRGLLFSLIDVSKATSNAPSGFIVICSSKETLDENHQSGRFDDVYNLLPPKPEERRKFIASCFYGSKDPILDPDTSFLLNELAECTEGLSLGGLALLCRHAVAKGISEIYEHRDEDDIHQKHAILCFLKDELQRSTPDSLKGGTHADSLDLRVFTGNDLHKMYPITNKDKPSLSLPLYGERANDAWQDLHRQIILPLCQGSDLEQILYHHGGSVRSQKSFSGGVLLCGPPGTGKSCLSYFCASFASALKPSVKLIDVSCTSLIHKEVGGSEKALHRLFQVIRSATPCVVIMDGIENIASPRGNDTTTEGTMDRLLSTLLVELDGVDSNATENNKVTSSSGMVLIGITQKESWIDPALRRPGRLERSIYLGPPEFDARRNIFLKELGDVTYKSVDGSVDPSTIELLCDRGATETEGFTGAELVAVCDFAKMEASKDYFLKHSRNSSTKSTDCDGGPFITARLIFNAIDEHKHGK